MAALLNSAYLYVDSTKYAAVAAWTALTSYAAGQLVRQLATPAVNSERVFVCVIAGTALASEPSWTLTKGALTAESAGPTWQECTGQPPVNGDVTNTLAWTTSAKSNTVVLGQIIKNDAASNYQICTTAGTCGSGAQPAFSATAGTTTADNTVTWTSLGAVGGFAAFAAPHARILNADSATWQTVVGSTIYIGHQHAETQAANNTLAGGQGTAAAPNKYLCISNTVAPPTAVTTGASASVSGANTFAIGSNKTAYWQGIAFNGAAGAAGALINIGNNAGVHTFENCSFNLITTDITSTINLCGSGVDGVVTYNTNFTFGATAQLMCSNNLQGIGGTIIGGSIAATGSVPTTLFSPKTNKPASLYLRDVDVSAIAGTFVAVASWTFGQILLADCKINAAVTMTSGTYMTKEAFFRLHNCDSGTKNYRFYGSTLTGTMQQDTTTYNNAGASDGTTHLSWGIASSSVASFYNPYQISMPIAIWNETVAGTVTATVEIAGANTLTNADIWMEIEYLGSAATPLGSYTSSRAVDIFATPVNVTTSSATWSGSPAVTQKLQVSFAPRMKGVVKATIFVARASTTVYVDPLITVA